MAQSESKNEIQKDKNKLKFIDEFSKHLKNQTNNHIYYNIKNSSNLSKRIK